MRSPLAGLIATVLIFVPLVAVPVLAICGMPQITALSNGAPTDDLKLAVDKDSHGPASKDGDLVGSVRVADSSAAGNETRVGHPRPSIEADPFAEFDRPPTDGSHDVPSKAPRSQFFQKKHLPRRSTDEGNGLTQTPLLAFADASPDESRSADSTPAERTKSKSETKPTERRQPRDGGDRETASIPEDSAAGRGSVPQAGAGQAGAASKESRGWREAVARLNALGIRDFQLQPGERRGEFHFSCRFASVNNPRVVHRFEAEAAEPLDAVAKVLRQIDDWRARASGRVSGSTSRDARSSMTVRDGGAERSSVLADDRSDR